MPYQVSVPFRSGDHGYASFRIPACVRAPDGALLAFAEGRVDSSADSGNIDVVRKRSTDGGLTWGALQVVDGNGTGTSGNPAPVVLAEAGRVVLVLVRNAATATESRIRRGQVSAADGRRVWVRHSDDSGQTWSPAREITSQVKPASWRWYATTPGHAVELRQPPHTGRLVVPANHSLPPAGGDNGTEGKYNGGHALLSDDGGQTWRTGYLDDNTDGRVNVNETTGAELVDGRLYLNTRNDSPAPGNRAHAWSPDGGATLTAPFEPVPELTAPVVQGSVLQLRAPDVLLFSAPGDPSVRRRMTVRASSDNGVSWRPVHTVDDRPAAYSDLVRADDGAAGLLYETGEKTPYETITFRRIPTEELA